VKWLRAGEGGVDAEAAPCLVRAVAVVGGDGEATRVERAPDGVDAVAGAVGGAC
jgi:hypothetical protein